MRPDSDIDVLVMTKLARRVGDRLKLRVDIAREMVTAHRRSTKDGTRGS